MNAEQAIHSFWSSFNLTAYDQNSVPDDAQLPYITYSLSVDTFNNTVLNTINIWYRSTSWINVTNKAKEIINTITDGGISIPTDNGMIRMNLGNPIYNRMGDEDKNIKRIRMNIETEYIETRRG
jgi:hypothetical protein